MYKRLDPQKIIQTMAQLRDRIVARFPDASLGRMGSELLRIAEETAVRAAWIRRPHVWLRIAIAVILMLIPLGLVLQLKDMKLAQEDFRMSEVVQTLQAGIESVVFIGAAVLFLVTLETRIKRRRTLQAIHELRAMAHIVDMHQLAKDPEQVIHAERRDGTAGTLHDSPDLVRYLDFCSELLSLISKVAALYVQDFPDPVALTAVDEVESLTTGLSRKIWQKIDILEQVVSAERRMAAPRSGEASAELLMPGEPH